MKGRRSYQEQGRSRLLDAWAGGAELGDPVGCVATTYTFDAGFFEEECLGRFVGMESAASESARVYLVEREERLSQVFSCVLVDRAHVAPDRSLRWHLLPVTVPRGGRFHPKVAVLAWQNRVRVLLGSANLTEPGYRRNLEHQATLELGPDVDDLPRALLHEVLDFLDAARRLAPGADAPDGPNRGLATFLDQVRALAAGFPAGSWPRGAPRADFVPVLPDGPDLFARLERLWSGPVARFADVLSPFYDDGETARAVARRLDALLASRGERELRFKAPGRRLADGTIELDLPEALREPVSPSAWHTFAYVPDRDDDGEARPLHAKSIWLASDTRALYVVGSSNFTAAGTGVGSSRNVEANLAYHLPDLGDAFVRICQAGAPRLTLVDVDSEEVRFRTEPVEATPEAQPYAPLPDGFGLALYELRGDGGVVRLELRGPLPAGFRVLRDGDGDGGAPVVDESEWTSGGSPAELERPWPDMRPPSHLVVTWSDDAGSHRALWVVNVTDSASLPPPEELRDLSLADLLEVLTSARPAHEVIAQILRRRAAQSGASGAGGVELDPHRKVDTRNFLLRRMRRVARALEGLRERLERPVHSEDALRWRLRGPFGPLVLARRLADEEREAAGFLVAEVAMTVQSASIEPGPALPRERVDAAIAAVLGELERLAAAHPAPANLADYVRRTFDEIRT